MKLEINGEVRVIPLSVTVLEVLVSLGVNLESVAVELNRHILRREDWRRTPIRDSDQVEIVRFGSGG